LSRRNERSDMSIPETLPAVLVEALTLRGYLSLTPVQEAVLAPSLLGVDLVVSAQTGSGKTVAFGLAMAPEMLAGQERLDRPADPVALIIAPTRELALQVQRELAWLYEPAGAKVVSCVGGMDARDERRALERGAHIVVGTPGRLADHIRRGSLLLDSLRVAVLDEADEMLNLGFREELEFILAAAPQERRTLMFSATMPKGIEALAQTYLRQSQRVNTVSAAKQHLDITYRALVTANHDGENAIFNVLRYYDATNAIVFCSTREGVNRMMSRFANRGFSVVALSGELSQKERTHALQAMRDHRAQVCVATDVAARGLDLPDLDLVIHADVPRNTEGLLHRSGRTGRAGRKGTSILIVPLKARRRVERLLQEAKVQAEWSAPPSADDVRARDEERLMAHPALTDPLQEGEGRLVEALMARHDARTIAAAFLRFAQKGMPAPEEIEPVSLDGGAKAARGERPERAQGLTGGVWMKMSVGRAQGAEPRWLIPMLCKAGGVSKRDIGSIRITDRETFVELTPQAVEAVFAAAGPDGRLEKSIFVAFAEPGGGQERSRPPRAPAKPRADAPRKEGPRTFAPRGDHPKAGPAAKAGRGPKFKDAEPAAAGPKPRSFNAPKPPAPKAKKKWSPLDQ